MKENSVSYIPLFTSGLYSIYDFNSYCVERLTYSPGYTAQFCINFTRSGYFTFNSYRRSDEEYTSRVLVEKPGCEFTLTQEHAGTGSCTVIRFTEEAYESIRDRFKLKEVSFFTNPKVFAIMLAASPEADYLHYAILKTLASGNYCTLEIDSLVLEMVEAVMQMLTGNYLEPVLPDSSRRHHLGTIERAKEYLLENFSNDISLQELAQHCYVSPFHFTRLFKQICAYSPFYFLQHIRLKHAETMLRTTELPIADICFRSGFNRLDYFSTTFTRKYAVPPSKYKSSLNQ
ncbi:MAG TPA: AraC family transcriptional regulator [Chitinophagaceae bacterium]|nr:AraC family transcriptional regulator [Chitinophagaceae bacterium]